MRKQVSGNFQKHVVALAATKTGDGLVDPKIVLAWMLTSLGAPAALLGWLVPLREAGSLFPQLFISGWISSLRTRNWVWAAGSVAQGACVAGMAAAAWTLQGGRAGWTVVALLAVFACARSVCSVTYKDVLGRTVPKASRGSATGAAASIAAGMTLLYGVLLSFGVLERSVATVAGGLLVAAALWLASAAVFTTLDEPSGEPQENESLFANVVSQFELFRTDPQLWRFIAVRGLLTATALAPPYLLALTGQQGGRELGALGPFVIASALASVLSGYVWGRLSDRSSRLVLAWSAALACLTLLGASSLAVFLPALFAKELVPPALLFVLMVAYQGVRLGRSTHLVDMAENDSRAAYTALSNTMIGVLLMFGGLFGLVAETGGNALTLAIFAAMCAIAAVGALTLDEVQQSA